MSVELNQPIPLIEIESNEKLKSNPVALNLLRNIDPNLKVNNKLLIQYNESKIKKILT
jgi:hypothetical protein